MIKLQIDKNHQLLVLFFFLFSVTLLAKGANDDRPKKKQDKNPAFSWYTTFKKDWSYLANAPCYETINEREVGSCTPYVGSPYDYIQQPCNSGPTYTVVNTYGSEGDNTTCPFTIHTIYLASPTLPFTYTVVPSCTGSVSVAFTGDTTGIDYCGFYPYQHTVFPGTYETSTLTAILTPATNTAFFTASVTIGNQTCITYSMFTISTLTVNFSLTNPCANSATQFNNASIPFSGETLGSLWDFGDGTPTSTVNSPSHTYSASGTYTVSLTATSNGQCAKTFTKTVTIINGTPPIVTVNSATICPNGVATFTASGALSYVWEPSAVLNNNTGSVVTGTPVGQLTVTGTGANSCASIAVADVQFLPTPTITISGKTDLCLGSTATLTATGAVSYTWLPSNSNAASFTDNPTTATSYTVIGTGITCTAQATSTITVYASPTIAFTSNTVCLTNATTLIDASNGNGFPITYYGWDFDNNGVANVTGVATTTNVFANYGNTAVGYSISTTPTVGLICSASTTQNVWVNPLPQPAFVFTNNCINAQPNLFDASASTIAIGTNSIYAWAFADSQTTNSTVATTTHTYSNVGLYTVTLTVTSDKGCVQYLSHQVEVYPKPIMSVSASSLICLGSIMSFTAHELANSGHVVSWLWDVNNSITSIETTGQYSGFTYLSAGTQTIALVSITNHACRDTMKRTVYINYNPVPDFVVDIPKGCPLPHCVEFTDQTPAITPPSKVVNWSWNFGNGSSNSVASNVNQHSCYTNVSSNQLALFTITLTTKTDSSCVKSMVKTDMITVYPKPIAAYTVTPDFGTVVVPQVNFTNQSIDYTKWYWYFGDGPQIDSIMINPKHYYNSNDANSYYTMLIVANQYGCRDTANLPVVIKPEFVFYIPNAFSPNTDNINEVFTGMGIGILEYEMWIFDRWGEQIYYSDDIYKGWDGNKLGTSEKCQQDVYTWKVELKDVFNKKHNYVGHVTLLR